MLTRNNMWEWMHLKQAYINVPEVGGLHGERPWENRLYETNGPCQLSQAATLHVPSLRHLYKKRRTTKGAVKRQVYTEHDNTAMMSLFTLIGRCWRNMVSLAVSSERWFSQWYRLPTTVQNTGSFPYHFFLIVAAVSHWCDEKCSKQRPLACQSVRKILGLPLH